MDDPIYKPGDRIRAAHDIRMLDIDDRAIVPSGTLGIVTIGSSDGSRQIQVAFEGYGLAIVFARHVEPNTPTNS